MPGLFRKMKFPPDSIFPLNHIPLYPSWFCRSSKGQVLLCKESSTTLFHFHFLRFSLTRFLNFQRNWTTSERSTATPSSRRWARKWRTWWGATSPVRSTSTCSVGSVCTDSCWPSACPRREEDVDTHARGQLLWYHLVLVNLWGTAQELCKTGSRTSSLIYSWVNALKRFKVYQSKDYFRYAVATFVEQFKPL